MQRLGRIAPRGREVAFVVRARTRNACPGCCTAPSARLRASSRRYGLAAWCAADPGPIVHSARPWVPALRCIVKNAAPRPGHEMTALQPNYLWLFENRIGNLQAAAGWQSASVPTILVTATGVFGMVGGAGAPLPTPRLRWVASSAALLAKTTDIQFPADFSSNGDVTIAAPCPIDND